MRKVPKLSPVIHTLLITQNMNGFTITDLRDSALSISSTETNSNELRKGIYRQVLKLLSKEFLRSEGSGRSKKYFKTALFNELFQQEIVPEISDNNCDVVKILQKDRQKHQADLEITLGEVECYKVIAERIPQNKKLILGLQKIAKEKSATLLGKINALSNVISAISVENKTC